MGFDEEYPMGYESLVYTTGHDAVQYVNMLMHLISQKEKDIILVGGQSNVLPVCNTSTSQMPCRQLNYMLGTQPDAVCLCVNFFDDVEYVKRNVQFLEAFLECKVIALVLFPFCYDNGWKRNINWKRRINSDEEEKWRNSIKMLNIPLYINDKSDYSSIAQKVIEYFGG